MKLSNPWVGYNTRSYAQIKSSLISKLRTAVPEMTDHSETNVFIILLSFFAGLAEQFHYYIDNMARESHISTARRFSSMVKLTRLRDYRIRAMIPSTTVLKLSFLDGDDEPVSATGTHTITIGTIFKTDNNLQFIATEEVDVEVGDTTVSVPVQQAVVVTGANLGTTTSGENQEYLIGTSYVDESLEVTINSVTWERVTTLGRSSATDKHFIVDVREDGKAYIVFGDDTNGDIPPAGHGIIASYKTSNGKTGNVDAGIINAFQTPPTISGVTTITVTNEAASVGGLNYEDVERIRRNAPLSLRTLGRAVTKQDHTDLAMLAPGVGKADTKHECGQKVRIYIVPEGGGIAQEPLLDSTATFMDEVKMLQTTITILPAGESDIYLELNIARQPFISQVSLEQAVKTALVDFYSFANIDMNQRINQSDIYATVDNLQEVNYLTLTKMYIIPYARPVEHTNSLSWVREVLANSGGTVRWKLEYDGSNIRVFKNSQFIQNIVFEEQFVDDDSVIKFTVSDNSYDTGDIWEFTTYPYNKDVQLDDYTIPALKSTNIKITHI